MKESLHKCYFAICKGKPKIKKYGKSGEFQIDGELLDFGRMAMVQQLFRKSPLGGPVFKLMVPADEIKSVVDVAAQPNISIFMFENEITKIIKGHLKEARDKDFLYKEVDVYGKTRDFDYGRYPAIRRVQLINLYLTWFRDDLKLIPKGGELSQWIDRLEILAQPVRLDGIPDDLTWTCMREDRVRKRNTECAKFLAGKDSQDFIKLYDAWKSAIKLLRRPLAWKVEYAGSIAYDPYDGRWIADHKAVIPSVRENIKIDHPLYILRSEDGKLRLKKALVPSQDGTAWSIEDGVAKEFVTGDPLFQVLDNDKCIDAEETLRGIVKEIPATISKRYASKIPFFNVEVNEDVVDK